MLLSQQCYIALDIGVIVSDVICRILVGPVEVGAALPARKLCNGEDLGTAVQLAF
jgi:hypothetical protein